MKFNTRYCPPASPKTSFTGKSMTRQEFAAECDINNIVARVGAGVLSPLRAPSPVYFDLDEVPQTYEESFALIEDAQERFESLPSRVRAYFDNDPAVMLAFLGDRSNRDKAIELGLIEAPVSQDVNSSKPSIPSPSDKENV